MTTAFISRVAVATATVALTAGALAAPAQAADAPASTEQAAATTWLAAQVPPGTDLFESRFGTGADEVFTDLGLNLDLQYALDQAGDTATADRVYDAIVADTAAYTDQFGTRYSGNIGKLATYVALHGDDPTAIDGRDLIADLNELLVTEGPSAGQLENLDVEEGGFFDPTTNTIGQSWGVRALNGADSATADAATDFLADQQCDDGGFRLNQNASACTSSADATSFAVVALAEVGGFDAEVEEAVDYLVDVQSADGSFSDTGSTNSNSTGLAGAVFFDQGESNRAVLAAGWVSGTQVASGPDAGAIAVTRAELALAGSSAIPALKRDSFVRATVQAVGALDVAPAAFTVTAPSGYLSAGREVPVSVSGALPGERVKVALSGGNTVTATAGADGTATLRPTAKGQGPRTAFVTGATSQRAGKAVIQVVGAKTLGVKVLHATRTVGSSQKLTVTGLAAGERVRVSYAGKSIKDTTADANGSYVLYFKVGTSKGKKTVAVLGAYGDRKGSTTFTIK